MTLPFQLTKFIFEEYILYYTNPGGGREGRAGTKEGGGGTNERCLPHSKKVRGISAAPNTEQQSPLLFMVLQDTKYY